MHFAQIVLPAILLAVFRAQSLEAASIAVGNEEFVAEGGESSSAGIGDASAAADSIGNQWFRHLEMQQRREQLIGQYRFMIAKSLLRLKDACKVYDWFVANDEPQAVFGGQQAEQRTDDLRVPPINTERYIQAILNQLQQTQTIHRLSDIFERLNSTSDPAINVLFYFVNTGSMLKDPRLDALLAGMLFDQCCSPGDPTEPCPRRDFENAQLKRDNSPPKKARFHSWGGKRSAEAKVVIRTPFHSWGGK